MKSILLFQRTLFIVVTTAVVVVAQTTAVTLSGIIKEAKNKAFLPFVNATLLAPTDSKFVTGSITNEEGLFFIPGIKPGNNPNRNGLASSAFGRI